MKNIVLAVLAAAFTVYSTVVIVENGYFGFLTLSLREPWAMQMLLDLTISLFLIGAWIRRDARQRDIPALPYLLLLPFLGSVATIGYFAHRTLKARARPGYVGATGG